MSSFVRNCWYLAAWDHEVLAETLFERQFAGPNYFDPGTRREIDLRETSDVPD